MDAVKELVTPDRLGIGDHVEANGAVFEIEQMGIWPTRRTEMIRVRCVDPLNTTFRLGFTKELFRVPLGGTWTRIVHG